MAREAFPRTPSGLVDLTHLNYPPRRPIPTNESKIVLPPPILACMGEDCTLRGEADECELTRHHLESTLPFFEAAGKRAVKFRKLVHLTVWLPECRHKEEHDTHELEAPLPLEGVMAQAIQESRRLSRIDRSYRHLVGYDKTMAQAGRTHRDIEGVKRAREIQMIKHERLLNRDLNIEVIPEELVTGALLLSAPRVAEARLRQGSGFALTGNMRREEVPQALEFAYAALNHTIAA